MKFLFLLTLLITLAASCSCENPAPLKDFKFKPGAMPTHRIHGQKILILDTIRESGCGCDDVPVLMYKVKGKDLDIHTINELELE